MAEAQLLEREQTGPAGAPVLEITRTDGFFELDRKACKAIGEGFARQYRNADPFPHIVLDNFLDREVLREVVRQFPQPEKGRFDDAYSHLKTGYILDKIRSAYI